MYGSKFIKPLLLVLMLAVASGHCHGQRRSSTLRFDSDSWDFGKINETDGPVTHVFTFTNTGSSALILESVSSDCGCTVPNHDRKPIKPGGKGSIEVTFNPHNQSGIVRKYVTVISDRGRNRNMLPITADVSPRQRTPEETYPLPIGGGLRAGELYLSFGNIQNNTVKTDSLILANTSAKTIGISVREITGSGLLSAVIPSSIAPGKTAAAVLTYAIDLPEPVYGPVYDKVFLDVDGVEAALPLSTYATVVDDFSKMSPLEVPHCVISPVFHNFGAQKPGASPTREITITNTGKGPLVVRSITTRSNTSCDIAEGTTVEPGKSITMKVTMKISRDAYGVVAGGLTIVVNDPDRPVREVRLASEIDN